MVYTQELFDELAPALLKLPAGTYWSVSTSEGFQAQAQTQAEARAIRVCFPGTIWAKHWSDHKDCKWWEYTGEWRGLPLHIYAVKEAPLSCKAIVETRIVEKQIPKEYETVRVEETAIVGWDCGPEDDHDD